MGLNTRFGALSPGIMAICAGLVFAGASLPAQALDRNDYARPSVPAEKRYMSYDGNKLPSCGDMSILGDIAARFAEREEEYTQSGVTISGFEAVVETGFRSSGLDYIPRRYCEARAIFRNGGKPRSVAYYIGDNTGWLGMGNGLTWCIEGYDRSYAYGANCRAAKP